MSLDVWLKVVLCISRISARSVTIPGSYSIWVEPGQWGSGEQNFSTVYAIGYWISNRNRGMWSNFNYTFLGTNEVLSCSGSGMYLLLRGNFVWELVREPMALPKLTDVAAEDCQCQTQWRVWITLESLRQILDQRTWCRLVGLGCISLFDSNDLGSLCFYSLEGKLSKVWLCRKRALLSDIAAVSEALYPGIESVNTSVILPAEVMQ